MSAYDFIAADKQLKPLEIEVKRKDNMIIIENEDHVLCLYEDEPNCYTEPFTELPSIIGVQIGDFENIKDELFNYVKDGMKENDTIEIWSTWMEETGGIEKKTIHENNLTVDELRWILGHKNWNHPRCLKIYKWTRGKK